MTLDLQRFNPFRPDPVEILKRRKAGQIYSADFSSSKGKYITTVIESDEPVDASIQVSPRIELRLTYIIDDETITGVQLTKLNSDGTSDKINLTTLDWQKVLALLKIFDDVDVKAIAGGSLILDSSIVDNPKELEKLLSTIAADPTGKEKMKEVADNFGLLSSDGIKNLALMGEGKEKMKRILNDQNEFNTEKSRLGVGKNEEVWQKLFEENDWMLGSEIVEILDERVIDEHSTVDLPVKSLDGFLDIVELKLPEAPFWTSGNYPNAELTKAITQCTRYLAETEKRANDHAKIEELGCDIVKPRITLIYGRTTDWTPEQRKQFRILNSSYHNISILTYDHVYQRASKQLGEKDEV